MLNLLEPVGVGVEELEIAAHGRGDVRHLLCERPQPRRLLGQPYVERRGGPDRDRGPRQSFLAEGVQRLLSELRQSCRMTRRGSLCAERFVLARFEVGFAQLLQPPAQVFLLPLSARPQLVQIAQGADRGDPGRVRGRDCGAHLERRGIGVEQLGLGITVEQCLVRVLAVDRDEVAADLA